MEPSSMTPAAMGSSSYAPTTQKEDFKRVSAPVIELPKGGGGIKAIDEKFSVNAVNGTVGCSIPFPLSSSRNGFMPALGLAYSTGNGNGPFGLGWDASPAAISRRTDKQLPAYRDEEESDTFMLSGVEDLVPVLVEDGKGGWTKDVRIAGDGTITTRYRPRIEGGFVRIEKIKDPQGSVFWKITGGNNMVTVYGRSTSAKITDPSDPARVFSWLPEFCYDDKGNCWQIGYKPEDLTGVESAAHEQNRLNGLMPTVNRYVKRLRYGNRVHFDRSTIRWDDWDRFLAGIEYMLEGVLDYGEHDPVNPQPVEDRPWTVRSDPYSHSRAGFEIRTWRLCRRVLMFHRFAELGATPCLVRSLELTYQEDPAFTFLVSATQKGHIRRADGTYTTKAMPPVTFDYAPLVWDPTVRELPADAAENLPAGLDEKAYRWVDLYNEGISGILTEQAGAWYYKSNAGDARFDGLQLVAEKPSLEGVATEELHFQDLEAKGQQFLVRSDRQGYYELGDDQHWLPYQTFPDIPRIDWQDPNLRMVDLNGDGMADVLITEDQVFTWYAAKGKEGFEPYRTVAKALDEEKGPAMVFADPTQSIVLGDMTGDGLPDIVRIRNSEVCYWPNLGYGRFGAKVTMSNAPVLDIEENFNPRWLRLADLDGSGTADLVYLGKNTFQVYFNRSGNSWSDVNIVGGMNPLPFPGVDTLSTVSVVDLLGRGTGCIVWSTTLPQPKGFQLRYIDLMGGQKPYLLRGYKNNMGRELAFDYQPSTYYYLQDKKAGTPWVTRLPMVIHCVSQVVVTDQLRKTRLTNQYSYHHGYFDHAEREFRGFGRVDQTDTEDFVNFRKDTPSGSSFTIVEDDLRQPPVLTRTWFHTGAFLDKDKLLTQFSHEYYQNAAVPEFTLTDPPLPEGLAIDEWREALRACKGMPLRTEIYSPDGSDRQAHPYATTQTSCLIRMLQQRSENRYAVFLVQLSESISYQYERNPADPRIGHSMTLAVDDFGNVLQSAAINYGRKTIDPTLTADEQAEQGKIHVVVTDNQFSNAIDTSSDFRLPVLYANSGYELTGILPTAGSSGGSPTSSPAGVFTISEILRYSSQAAILEPPALPVPDLVQKRLIGRSRALFLKNDLSGPLEAGVIESLVLPYQSYKLSFTPGLLDAVYGDKVSHDLLVGEGKYLPLDDGNYWIASGTQTFDPANFFQATIFTDAFGSVTRVQYDPTYRWYVQQTTDAIGNAFGVTGFNFRTLGPWLVTDSNDNRSGARIDELGMVMATFVMGKETEELGDRMDTTTPEASATDRPSGTLEYDLFRYVQNGSPNLIRSTQNETHFFDGPPDAPPPVTQTGYSYVDGMGQVLLKKIQAKPGPALQENGDGTVTEVDTTPNLRWIGNGRTILNNKGKPVMQYEPYFSVTPDFEDNRQLVERGMTSISLYDSLGRGIRIDYPDGTFIRTSFDTWTQQAYDRNDTVLDSRWYRDRILSPDPAIATPEEVAVAHKTSAHANTPSVSYLDSLGRVFVAVADNGPAGKVKVSSGVSIEGNLLSITDALGNTVMQYRYDLLGAPLYHLSMDTGEQWKLNDAMGKPLRTWDNRQFIWRYESDPLHRPKAIFVQVGTGVEVNVEKIVYGENAPDPLTNNLRGRSYRHYDAAGVTTAARYDFKGNSVEGSRQLLANYKDQADWSQLGDGDLGPDLFTTVNAGFDALNRPLNTTLPDGSILRPVYGQAGVVNEVRLRLRGGAETPVIQNIDYSAKGQRESILYGNNTRTSYIYDPATFRTQQLITTANGQTSPLQDIRTTFDPVGNLSFTRDAAQPDIFFDGIQVQAANDYVYDALYRLISATGREQIGQNTVDESAANDDFRNFPFRAPASTDTQAFRNYTQQYSYDDTGNIRRLQHIAGAGSYTRTYQYNNNDDDRAALHLDPTTVKNNRLLATTAGAATTLYQYDPHGNMLNLPHLASLGWDAREELRTADLGGGGKAWYVYDAGGQRVRKVIERLDGSRTDRIYLGAYEIYRETDSGGKLQQVTETVNIREGEGRVAMVEVKTTEDGKTVDDGNLEPLWRYQYSNGQGSACLELDENAVPISYEEYHPYGTTSYESTNKDIQAASKRYRYIGMERDEESGLAYHGARYYLPWLGRWLSPDPACLKDGWNIYEYTHSNPVSYTDATGNEARKLSRAEIVTLDTVVYDRWNTGLAKVMTGGTKEELEVAWFFIRLGEMTTGECSAKVDRLLLFDIGAKLYAQAYGLEKRFAAEARAGMKADEKRKAGTIYYYQEFIGGQLLIVPETRAQHEHWEDVRAEISRRGFDWWVNMVGSMGLPGVGGGGAEGPGEGTPPEPPAIRSEPPAKEPAPTPDPVAPAPVEPAPVEAAPEPVDNDPTVKTPAPPGWRPPPPPGKIDPKKLIVSPVFQYSGRDFVIVNTEYGRQGFYRSSGRNSKQEDRWLPFDEIVDRTPEFFPNVDFTKEPKRKNWFNKGQYGTTRSEGHALQRVGNEHFGEISHALDLMNIPKNIGIPLNTKESVNNTLNQYNARVTPGNRLRGVNR